MNITMPRINWSFYKIAWLIITAMVIISAYFIFAEDANGLEINLRNATSQGDIDEMMEMSDQLLSNQSCLDYGSACNIIISNNHNGIHFGSITEIVN
jgi:hypothetical protein